MPKLRSPQIQTRLSAEDSKRLNELCKVEQKTKTEVLRDAVRWYLDNQEDLKSGKIKEQFQDKYIATSAKQTDRICAMLNRALVEIGTLYCISGDSFSNQELFDSFVNQAKDRIRKKLSDSDRAEAKRLSKHVQDE